MRDITKLMIAKYKLLELKYDFMGYDFDKERELSFHHLVIPKRLCVAQRIAEDGYLEWNGAILKMKTAHNYLHTIERYDRDRFEYITERMKEMNENGKLDTYNLERIEQALRVFETGYSELVNKNGKALVKSSYYNRIFYR